MWSPRRDSRQGVWRIAVPGRVNETSEKPFVAYATDTGGKLLSSIATFSLMGLAKVYSEENFSDERVWDNVCFG